ncbi:MAG TPA: alpha/beta fold hydrolase [Ignavibacteriales bacterium]|nr:alpha/beta fold hydrolase [Ignavibacteriales bacterium]
MKNYYFIMISLFMAAFNSLYAQNPIAGHWEGTLQISAMKLNITVNFEDKTDSLKGTIDILQQNAIGLELSNIKFENPKVHFELANAAMPSRLAKFDGQLKDSLIEGEFQQLTYKGTFSLKKTALVKTKEEPVPYKQEDITYKNGNITFAGTLTIPPSEGKHPAVVLITGSGAQNRDEEIFGFKPFKIIADRLTRKGFAVLRVDDRGVGGSSGGGTNPTTEDFAEDIKAGVDFLKTRHEINPSQIGLCGHSEGGVIAPMLASQYKDIAFIVLISGTGVPGDSVILSQLQAILKASGMGNEEIEKKLTLQRQILSAVKSGQGWDAVKARWRQDFEDYFSKMSDEQKKQIPDKEAYIKQTIEGQLAQLQSRWYKFFVEYNPAVALEKVKCPVLMFFGGKDLQVIESVNKDAMVKALENGGNKNFTVKEFPDANHLYQKANTGAPSEYFTLKKEFVPGFLDTMTDWLKKLFPEVSEVNSKEIKK